MPTTNADKNLIKELKQQLKQANEKALRYELLFELSDDAILVIKDGKFTDCNQAVIKMLGYNNKSEFLNTHPSELSPERQPDGKLSYEKAQEMMELAIQKGSHHFEWIHTKSNGEDFPVEVWLSTVKHGEDVLINTIWRDLTEIKKAQNKVKQSLKEKEVLLQEIHHRVKNNLQIITSLLSLQSKHINSPELADHFHEARYRIMSMAMVHEMLYQSENLSTLQTGEYIQNLILSLIELMKADGQEVVLDFYSDDVNLNIDTSIPLGLLINEIITNAIKHGFPNQKDGVIHVRLSQTDDTTFDLNIGDNGVGMPADFDPMNSTSLGQQLIETLVSQLNGTFSLDTSLPGTNYIIQFQEVKGEL